MSQKTCANDFQAENQFCPSDALGQQNQETYIENLDQENNKPNYEHKSLQTQNNVLTQITDKNIDKETKFMNRKGVQLRKDDQNCIKNVKKQKYNIAFKLLMKMYTSEDDVNINLIQDIKKRLEKYEIIVNTCQKVILYQNGCKQVTKLSFNQEKVDNKQNKLDIALSFNQVDVNKNSKEEEISRFNENYKQINTFNKLEVNDQLQKLIIDIPFNQVQVNNKSKKLEIKLSFIQVEDNNNKKVYDKEMETKLSFNQVEENNEQKKLEIKLSFDLVGVNKKLVELQIQEEIPKNFHNNDEMKAKIIRIKESLKQPKLNQDSINFVNTQLVILDILIKNVEEKKNNKEQKIIPNFKKIDIDFFWKNYRDELIKLKQELEDKQKGGELIEKILESPQSDDEKRDKVIKEIREQTLQLIEEQQNGQTKKQGSETKNKDCVKKNTKKQINKSKFNQKQSSNTKNKDCVKKNTKKQINKSKFNQKQGSNTKNKYSVKITQEEYNTQSKSNIGCNGYQLQYYQDAYKNQSENIYAFSEEQQSNIEEIDSVQIYNSDYNQDTPSCKLTGQKKKNSSEVEQDDLQFESGKFYLQQESQILQHGPIEIEQTSENNYEIENEQLGNKGKKVKQVMKGKKGKKVMKAKKGKKVMKAKKGKKGQKGKLNPRQQSQGQTNSIKKKIAKRRIKNEK